MNRIKRSWRWWRGCGFNSSEVIIGIGVLACAYIIFLMLLMMAVRLIPALIVILLFILLMFPLIYWGSKPRSPSLRIKRPPGVLLLMFVDFFFSRKIVEEVFKPIAADWLTEYYEALNEGRRLKARWISIRYIYRFILAMGLSKIFSFFKSLTPAGK